MFDAALPFEATPSIFDSIADSVWFSEISKNLGLSLQGTKKLSPFLQVDKYPYPSPNTGVKKYIPLL